MNNILIIGNGFDLDMGLKTRYSDFATSNEWKECANEESNLYKYLETKKNIERWFDLEAELYNYATYNLTRSYTYVKDELYFRDLHQYLRKYLQKQQEEKINVKSSAAGILSSVANNASFRNIYSFNYTDLNIFAKQLGIEIKSNCHYIHGSLSENSIILGVDERPLASKYDFLHKTMSPNYQSHNLFEDLKVADEVIFFGLSFGDIDFTYFKKFFLSQSNGERLGKRKKKITIITWDEESRSDILKKLKSMNVDRQELYAQSEFVMIRTSLTEDRVKLNKLCDRLRRQKSDEEIIANLVW